MTGRATSTGGGGGAAANHPLPTRASEVLAFLYGGPSFAVVTLAPKLAFFNLEATIASLLRPITIADFKAAEASPAAAEASEATEVADELEELEALEIDTISTSTSLTSSASPTSPLS